MKNIKLNLNRNPSLVRVAESDFRFDGDFVGLFSVSEILKAYEIIMDVADEDVVMSSSLFHLSNKFQSKASRESLLSKHSTNFRYSLYSSVQDALLRFVTSRAIELVESLPDVKDLSSVAHRKRFLSAFELLSQKYQQAPQKILPIELLADSNSGYWKLMFKLLSDRKVYSQDMSAAMFADLVEHFSSKTNLLESNPVSDEFFDLLSNDKTFQILKVSRVFKDEVPYLETEEKNPFTLMKESKLETEFEQSFNRFVDISSYSAIGLDLVSIVDSLLNSDRSELLKNCSGSVAFSRRDLNESECLDF